MSTKASADIRSLSFFESASSLSSAISREISAMTYRTVAVGGAMLGMIVPLAQYSYDEPVKGLILALMLPTPTVRRLIAKAAGLSRG